MVGLTKTEATTTARANYEKEQRKRNKKNKYNAESGRYDTGTKKKKIVPRDRSNTSRKGVGTLEGAKPKRKDMTGVNQTPISFKDVAKATGKGAASGASLILNPFGKAGLIAKAKAKLEAYNKARKARMASNSQKQITYQKKLEDKRPLTKAEKLEGNKYLDPANPDMRMADIGFKKGGAVKMNKGGTVKKAAYKKGGVVKKTRSTTKKKSIDGIAMRGKTKATRSR